MSGMDLYEMFELGQFLTLVIGGLVLLVIFSVLVVLNIGNRIKYKRRPWWKFWDWYD